MSLAIAVIARNEEAIIGEWIAHHLHVGFDKILVYDNGSEDNTRKIVAEAAEQQPVELISWTRTGADFQDSAYADALERTRGVSDWLALLDADEFLSPGAGLTVAVVLDSVEDADAVGVNWAIFGSGGRDEPASGLVTETYLMRSAADFMPNNHVKSIVRPTASTRTINCHMAEVSGRYVDPCGQPIDWAEDGVTTAVRGWDRLKVNHYFVRSRADWERKVRRGYRDMDRAMELFDTYDQNIEYDPALEKEAGSLRSYPFVRVGEPGEVQRTPTWRPESFDPEVYLDLNPDVREAGLEAEHHWRYFGKNEGRAYKR